MGYFIKEYKIINYDYDLVEYKLNNEKVNFITASNLNQIKIHFDNEKFKKFLSQENTYINNLSKIIGEKRNIIEKIFSIIDLIN